MKLQHGRVLERRAFVLRREVRADHLHVLALDGNQAFLADGQGDVEGDGDDVTGGHRLEKGRAALDRRPAAALDGEILHPLRNRAAGGIGMGDGVEQARDGVELDSAHNGWR